jgi:hypothetical protein
MTRYENAWVGIDAGREGLWREPIWSGVLSIIGEHQGEEVYDEHSPIYLELERRYPNESWRSHTAEGQFRPLFRDYPNSWTRTGVVSLENRKFRLTELGKKVASGEVTKSSVLIRMFKTHTEVSPKGVIEKPFVILANGLLIAPRPLETREIYWTVMLGYRPHEDDLAELLKQHARQPVGQPEATPYRRLRNMLTLMRSAGAIESTVKRGGTFWAMLDREILDEIARAGVR